MQSSKEKIAAKNRESENKVYMDQAKNSIRGRYNYLGGYYEGAKLPTGESVPLETQAACIGVFSACEERLQRIEEQLANEKNLYTRALLLKERAEILALLSDIKNANTAPKRTWSEWGASWSKLLGHVYNVEIKKALRDFILVSILACIVGVTVFLLAGPIGWAVGAAIVATYVLYKLCSMFRGFYNSCVEENSRMAAEQMAKGTQIIEDNKSIYEKLDEAAEIELKTAKDDLTAAELELVGAEKEVTDACEEVEKAKEELDSDLIFDNAEKIEEHKQKIGELTKDIEDQKEIIRAEQAKKSPQVPDEKIIKDAEKAIRGLEKDQRKLEREIKKLDQPRKVAETKLKAAEKKQDAAEKRLTAAKAKHTTAKEAVSKAEERKAITGKNTQTNQVVLTPVSTAVQRQRLDPNTGRQPTSAANNTATSTASFAKKA